MSDQMLESLADLSMGSAKSPQHQRLGEGVLLRIDATVGPPLGVGAKKEQKKAAKSNTKKVLKAQAKAKELSARVEASKAEKKTVKKKIDQMQKAAEKNKSKIAAYKEQLKKLQNAEAPLASGDVDIKLLKPGQTKETLKQL